MVGYGDVCEVLKVKLKLKGNCVEVFVGGGIETVMSTSVEEKVGEGVGFVISFRFFVFEILFVWYRI